MREFVSLLAQIEPRPQLSAPAYNARDGQGRETRQDSLNVVHTSGE